MITLITKQSAEQLAKSRKRDIYNYRNAVVDSINKKTGTLVAYNLDTYEFVFKIDNEEINVAASYFRPRRVFEGTEEELIKLRPKNVPDYIPLKGILTGITNETNAIYSVGEFTAAHIDIAMANKMEGKTLKFATETVANTLIWSSEKSRYFALDSYLVTVTATK